MIGLNNGPQLWMYIRMNNYTHPSLYKWGSGNGICKDPLDDSVKTGISKTALKEENRAHLSRASQICLLIRITG